MLTKNVNRKHVTDDEALTVKLADGTEVSLWSDGTFSILRNGQYSTSTFNAVWLKDKKKLAPSVQSV